jgi:hypothetical protein
MAYLIVGPSSSGKSTYIKELIAKKKVNKNNLIFGIQLKKKFLDNFKFWKKKVKIKKNSVLHFNIFQTFFYDKDTCSYNLFEIDKIFKRLLKDIYIFNKVIILFTPIEELMLRVKNRLHVEHGDNLTYEKKSFIKIYNKTNFYHIYNIFFKIMDKNSIKYKILFSSKRKFVFCDKNKVISNLKNYYKYKK